MKNRNTIGHITATLTIIIWSTTFISTKILLQSFSPIEIQFIRFLMGLVALFIAKPKLHLPKNLKEELTFAGAGLCGVCLYYLLENIALTMTFASNVGVIISVAPFFTALLAPLMHKKAEKPNVPFFIGFVIAMSGIYILSFKSSALVVNPTGDLLTLLAAVVWALYSNIIKKTGKFGYHTIITTRRVFEYGILFMIPAMFYFNFTFDLQKFLKPISLGNFMFLGFLASALCFVTWNFSVKVLGVIRTSVYIYLGPVITLIASVIILHEPVNAMTITGAFLTMSGLFVSEIKHLRKTAR